MDRSEVEIEQAAFARGFAPFQASPPIASAAPEALLLLPVLSEPKPPASLLHRRASGIKPSIGFQFFHAGQRLCRVHCTGSPLIASLPNRSLVWRLVGDPLHTKNTARGASMSKTMVLLHHDCQVSSKSSPPSRHLLSSICGSRVIVAPTPARRLTCQPAYAD
jgi:hypothetical protein